MVIAVGIGGSVAEVSMGIRTADLVRNARAGRIDNWVMLGLADDKVGMNQSKEQISGKASAEKSAVVADWEAVNAPKAWQLVRLESTNSEILGRAATAHDTDLTRFYGGVVLEWQWTVLLASLGEEKFFPP